jgi:carboxypeptidase family protein
MRVLACAVVVFSLSIAASAQTPQQPAPPGGRPGTARDNAKPQAVGTARLSGRVLNGETGKALRRAVVRAMAAEIREARSASTDADGKWEIKDLPAGRYQLLVQKGGFVSLQYGQRRPFEQGKPVELVDAQAVENLDVALPKGGVVTGRIVDEFGEAVAGARVSAMRHRFMQGQRRLVPVEGQGTTDTTDDLGQFRLHGLPPGSYYVSASVSSAILEVSTDRTGYTGTYFPGTPAVAEAERVTVAVGRETAEINFPLAPAKVAKVSGTAVNSDGKPLANAMVFMTSLNGLGLGGSPLMGTALTRGDGSFTIGNVAPGDYQLQTMSMSDMESVAQTGSTLSMAVTEAAFADVTVAGQDLTGVSLVSAPTTTVSGKITFDGTAPNGTAAANTFVTALPETPMALPLGGNTMAKPDWTFQLRGLTGKRFFRLNPPKDWSLKAVRVNGVDVTDIAVDCKTADNLQDLEFVLTQAAASLTGTVEDGGKPARDYTVILFSPDSHRWGYQTRFVRSARPDQSGSFTLKGVPPDDYLAVALEYVEPGQENDPELLERLRASATAITIHEGQAKTISLKLSR